LLSAHTIFEQLQEQTMTDTISFEGRSGFEPALSWSAIFAGSLVAVATSVFLTLLASGFGYELTSGALASKRSLEAFSPELGAGAVAIQVVSAGLGGYLAGRLRQIWTLAHADEAHFRDTAHGLIVWALSAIAGLVLAALVFAPYANAMAPALAAPPTGTADVVRSGHIVVQSAFFAAVGMLLSAFVAAVAARIGGMQTEHMHGKRGA
jgi:hypothetical protein